MNDCGLVWIGHSLGYGYKHGVHLPYFIQRIIVAVVNRITCSIYGHDDTLFHLVEDGCIGPDESVCCMCQVKLKKCLCLDVEPPTT